jgi:hypothetical protein
MYLNSQFLGVKRKSNYILENIETATDLLCRFIFYFRKRPVNEPGLPDFIDFAKLYMVILPYCRSFLAAKICLKGKNNRFGDILSVIFLRKKKKSRKIEQPKSTRNVMGKRFD